MITWGIRFSSWLMKHMVAPEDVRIELVCRDRETAHRVTCALRHDLLAQYASETVIDQERGELERDEVKVAGIRVRAVVQP